MRTIADVANNTQQEGDTFLHSWESLAEIIVHEECQDILLDM